MLTDPQIRDIALKRFTIEAPAKFTKGMQEHNPDGTKRFDAHGTLTACR